MRHTTKAIFEEDKAFLTSEGQKYNLEIAEQRLARYRRAPTQARPADEILDRLAQKGSG